MGADTPRVIYRFGDFECDSSAYELRRKGRRIALARLPMDLLLLMLRRPGELISRAEIAANLWGDGVFVDVEAGIRTAVLKVREALGDSGKSPRLLETVPGKGYRFIGAVRPSPSAPGVRRHNLPADLTRFIGREQPLAELRHLLRSTRLLSLTGPGGVGKTRLALRLGLEVSREFSDGVWMVDLAPLTSSALVGQSIASVLGVRESRERSVQDALVDYLRDRDLLLMLDTCEHVVDRCAELADALLRASRGLRIIATTREPLSLSAETVYLVPALTAAEGAALFVERALAAHAAFRADPRAVESIAGICRRLEGVPLAIELAAAQVPLLTPEQIEARLADGLFAARTRTSVTRQRSLDATIAWSYELLSESERLLLECVSVFPGTWTLAGARHVGSGAGLPAAEIGDIQARLQSKSLVMLAPDNCGIRRHRLVDTVRHFAARRLEARGMTASMRDRHFEFFHLAYRDSGPVLVGASQGDRLRELSVEIENLRAALDWGLSSPELSERAAELTAALFWFWTKRGLFEEGRGWLLRATQVPVPPVLKAYISLGLGHMDYFQGRFSEMSARNEEVLAWGRQAGDEALISFALFGQALARFECGAFDEAEAYAEATREVAKGRPFGSPLLVLGNVALVRGDHDRALSNFDEAMGSVRQAGEIWGLGILLSLAAGLRTIRGDFEHARALAAEALSIYRELEDRRGIAWSLDVLAGLLAADGRVEDAARLWGASDALLESVGGSLVPTIGWIRDRHMESAAGRLGSHRFQLARAEGREMLSDEAATLALGAPTSAFNKQAASARAKR